MEVRTQKEREREIQKEEADEGFIREPGQLQFLEPNIC